jgi:hypothetical protein
VVRSGAPPPKAQFRNGPAFRNRVPPQRPEAFRNRSTPNPDCEHPLPNTACATLISLTNPQSHPPPGW